MQYFIWGNFFGLIGYGYDWIWMLVLPPIIFVALYAALIVFGLIIELCMFYFEKKSGKVKNYEDFQKKHYENK